MNLNPLKWFNKKGAEEPDIDFRDTTAQAFEDYPPKLAKDVPIFFKETQKKNQGTFSFAGCPGMWDYSQYGYILTSPDTIMIKANKAGSVALLKKRGISTGGVPCAPMDHKLIEGYCNFDGVPPNAFKYDLPWRVICKKNISAILMPPYYHANYHDSVHIIPGIVDYKNFWTINMIFAVKKPCEIIIKAGDPILHVFPFWNKPIKANYGMIEIEQMTPTVTAGFDSVAQYYRKRYNVKKVFNLGKSNGEEN